MTVVIESDSAGPKAVVFDRWTADDVGVIRASGVKRVQIARFRGPDLNFLVNLADYADLDEVDVIQLQLRSDSGVEALPYLRALSLETYSQDRLDFRKFPMLERLSFNWRPGGDTVFQCSSLRSLRVSRYPEINLTVLRGLVRLERLRIDNSRRLRSLDCVGSLSMLTVLSLRDDRELNDVGALASLGHSLREFELNVCRKVSDISALSAHRELRRVMLIDCGRIASIAPLADLPTLEEFWFYGTTVIEDGDMTPLLRMPSLQRVSFAPRRHYSHRTEDIYRIRGLTASEPLPHWRW
jgi:hypothetical protein